MNVKHTEQKRSSMLVTNLFACTNTNTCTHTHTRVSKENKDTDLCAHTHTHVHINCALTLKSWRSVEIKNWVSIHIDESTKTVYYQQFKSHSRQCAEGIKCGSTMLPSPPPMTMLRIVQVCARVYVYMWRSKWGTRWIPECTAPETES